MPTVEMSTRPGYKGYYDKGRRILHTGGQKGDHLSAVRRLRLLEQIPESPLIRDKVPGAEVLDDLDLAVVHVLLLHLDKHL